jgi:phosphatidylinositol-3-phosphatase
VGLLLISPYVKANSIDVVDYFNHFSLLASIENLFGFHRLGYAGVPGLPVFSAGVFNKYQG